MLSFLSSSLTLVHGVVRVLAHSFVRTSRWWGGGVGAVLFWFGWPISVRVGVRCFLFSRAISVCVTEVLFLFFVCSDASDELGGYVGLRFGDSESQDK